MPDLTLEEAAALTGVPLDDGEVVDGTAVEEHAVVVRPAALAVTPQVEASELVARLDVIKDAMQNAMTADVDYGVIPGTQKPTLLKPGAEKLNVLFQLDVQLTNQQERGPGNHLTVTSRAVVYHAPTGKRLGYGEGMCSTLEKKYAKRRADRLCPVCGKPAIIKGKAEYGGGWLCFKKKDGCGAKFVDEDPQITGQEVGEVENPDLPDLWNTVLKMAEKRARVDAVLAVTGASAIFTQDVEDFAQAAPEPEPAPAPPPPADPPRPPKPITAARAKKLLAGVEGAGLADQLPMAVGHVTGTQFADLPAATDALKKLGAEQADAIQRWVDKHSEPAS